MYIGSKPGTQMSPTDLGMSIMRGIGADPGIAQTQSEVASGSGPPAGHSSLSPQELAIVQQQNMALQQQAASKQIRMEKTIALVVGGVLVLGLGVALFKALSHSEHGE